jgi:hypothetical protein
MRTTSSGEAGPQSRKLHRWVQSVGIAFPPAFIEPCLPSPAPRPACDNGRKSCNISAP